MMKLYYVPLTRAMRPRWMLEELEVPYELVRVDPAGLKHRTPEYMTIHPFGHVPGFEDGEVKMFESGAIVAYLADKYIDKGFAPPFGTPARGDFYKWMFFAQATMEIPLVEVFQHVVRLPEDQRDVRVIARARARWAEICGVLDRHLAARPYMLGDAFSAPDVMIAAGLAWSKSMGMLEGQPGLTEYSKRCHARPAAKRARAD